MCAFSRVLDAYRTGRGRVVVRGKAEVELLDPKTKRNAVIISEVINFLFKIYLLIFNVCNGKKQAGRVTSLVKFVADSLSDKQSYACPEDCRAC